uniref:Uncharacterized protein n=1 Tax=Anguilla anguilla TaxID=7936 RepID=A0A0E9TSA3_ANGAN
MVIFGAIFSGTWTEPVYRTKHNTNVRFIFLSLKYTC